MKHWLSAPLDFLDDFHGNKSSKRFWGNRCLTIGVLLKVNLYGLLLITPIIFGQEFPQKTFENCSVITDIFFYSGVGLLFGGILERIKSKK